MRQAPDVQHGDRGAARDRQRRELRGTDEGAFLYWEFEVKDGRNQEEAEAAMREAFAGQELADCLVLYREHKAKLPTLPEYEKPTLRLHRPDREHEPTEEP